MTSLYPTSAHLASEAYAERPDCQVYADDQFVLAKTLHHRQRYQAAQVWLPPMLQFKPYRCTACGHRFDTSTRYPAKITSCPSCAMSESHSAPVVWVGPGIEPD